jgi:hypothetical protein
VSNQLQKCQVVLEIDKEYAVGVPIDWELHGVHGTRGSLFTVLNNYQTYYKNCRYEGFGNLFSTESGEVLTNVRFFRIQPK